jgi:HlyD family secretion protein
MFTQARAAGRSCPWAGAVVVALTAAVASAAPAPGTGGVGALGRLQPKNGVTRVAGPSEMVLVLSEMLVDDGDPVKAGQVIARLDDFPVKEAALVQAEANLVARQADVMRMEATLKTAKRDLERAEALAAQQITTNSDLDRSRLDVETAEANVASAKAQVSVAKAGIKMAHVDVERRTIRSPVTGRVLKVYARAGEKVSSNGIVEVGRTDAMYAVAEVYETDVARVHVGQKARVKSPVLPRELTGTVERISMKVGRKSIVNDDATADRDVRVVEVEVKLDDSAAAAPFTQLQVEVRFEP